MVFVEKSSRALSNEWSLVKSDALVRKFESIDAKTFSFFRHAGEFVDGTEDENEK